MNRLVRGSVLFAVAAILGACGGINPDGSDTTDHLTADPAVVFVSNVDSQAVFVEALNAIGQQLEGDFAITNVGPGLTAFIDENYQPVTGREGNPTRVRIFVKAATNTTFVSSSITVSANGESIVIPVNITPNNLSISLSNATPQLGEAVTVTAPANVRFTPGTVATVPGGVAVITGLSADSTELTLLFGPGITDQSVTFSNVVLTYLPGQTFTLATTGTVTTPVIAAIPASFSPANPQVGDTVTMTLTAPYKALPNASIAYGTNTSIILSISADSSTVTFLPPPGSSGAPTLSNFVLGFLTSVPLSLPASNSLNVQNATRYTGSDSPATAPAVPVPTVVNDTVDFFDIPQFVDQFYTMNITIPGTYRLVVSWPGTGLDPDIDMFFANAAVTGAFCSGATAALPEACNANITAAGSYRIYINLYHGSLPAWYRIRLIRVS